MAKQIKKGIKLYSVEGITSLGDVSHIESEKLPSDTSDMLRCTGVVGTWADANKKYMGAYIVNWTLRWTNAEKTRWQIEVDIPGTIGGPSKLQGTLAAPAK
jgi:hypothetical protein